LTVDRDDLFVINKPGRQTALCYDSQFIGLRASFIDCVTLSPSYRIQPAVGHKVADLERTVGIDAETVEIAVVSFAQKIRPPGMVGSPDDQVIATSTSASSKTFD